MSTQAETQPTYIALPCTFVSLLITSFVTKAMTSPTEKGLTTFSKATCIFFFVLVFTTATTKILLGADKKSEEEDNEHSNFEHPKPSVAPSASHKNIAEWCDDVRVASSAFAHGETRADRRRPQRQRIYSRTEFKAEEKRVRNILREQLKRRNNELLGKRKDTVVEVMDEEGA
jgi:hypothetical protein